MSTYSIGLMNQLGDALSVAGYREADINELRLDITRLRQIKGVLLGQSEIVAVSHAVDLDADPFVQERFEVEEHIRGGQFVWDPAKVVVGLISREQTGRPSRVEGSQLRQEIKLKSLPVFNANLLDWLLQNPRLIPEEWKDKHVHFWGTIYRSTHGSSRPAVRCLMWLHNRWTNGMAFADTSFGSKDYAAILKST